jgi:hypothetical protein
MSQAWPFGVLVIDTWPRPGQPSKIDHGEEAILLSTWIQLCLKPVFYLVEHINIPCLLTLVWVGFQLSHLKYPWATQKWSNLRGESSGFGHPESHGWPWRCLPGSVVGLLRLAKSSCTRQRFVEDCPSPLLPQQNSWHWVISKQQRCIWFMVLKTENPKARCWHLGGPSRCLTPWQKTEGKRGLSFLFSFHRYWDLVLARQALYHLSPFCLAYFSDKMSHLYLGQPELWSSF